MLHVNHLLFGMRRLSVIPTVLGLLHTVRHAAAQSTYTYWSEYPLCSELCYEQNFAASGCSLTKACLCANVPWLQAVAACIAINCPFSQLAQSATICQEACYNSNTPMAISPEEFIDAGTSALYSATAGIPLPTIPTYYPNTPTWLNGPATLELTTYSASSSEFIASVSYLVAQSTSSVAVSSKFASTVAQTLTSTVSTATSFTPASTAPQVSPASQPSDVSCSDPSWAVTPENWQDANVDFNLRDWWNNNITASQKSSNSFVGLLFNISGNGAQQCGVGADSTCGLPYCPGNNVL